MAGVVEPSRDTHGYWPQGTSPFPKEGRSKAPANNKAMAYHGLQDIKDKHAQRTVQTKHIPSKVKNVTYRKKSHICQRTDQHKRLQHTSYHTSSRIRTGNEQCLWFQPATLRLTLSNHCPSQTKRIPDDPKPTDHNGQYTQSTSGDLWLAPSFRKWIKDCCHPWWHYVADIWQASHSKTNSLWF